VILFLMVLRKRSKFAVEDLNASWEERFNKIEEHVNYLSLLNGVQGTSNFQTRG
jgi:hypothetical protein